MASQELRKALRSGVSNVKDRLTIQLENDMRHGTARFDNWVYPAKVSPDFNAQNLTIHRCLAKTKFMTLH